MNYSTRAIVCSAAVLLIACAAHAVDFYWSGDGSSQGGNGMWDTNSLRWGAAAGGPFDIIWTNASNDTAVFGGTAGTVMLGTNIQVGALLFTASGYTISGANQLTFGLVNNFTNNVGSVTVSGGATVTNFSGTAYIGYNNNGPGKSLTIEDGGRWYGGSVYVGYGSSANAKSNSYNVGGAGAASIVSNSAVYVGWGTGISGPANFNTMTVSNATLHMGGTLTIAHAGNGVNNNWVIVGSQGSIQMGNNGIVILPAADYGYPAYGSNNGLMITNGGYVSAGAITVNYNGNPGNVVIANGGTLVTTGATSMNGLMTITGGGVAGPTSIWNLTGTNLVVSGAGNSGTLIVDGNGMNGGAVVTNVIQLLVGSPGSGSGTMLMTNGARGSATAVWIGKSNPGASSNNKLTIMGGAANSILNAGGGSVTVGYLPNNTVSDNNQLIIGAGGILTNAGPMLVANAPNRNYNGICNNLLVVTNGGQLFTTGNSFISQDFGAGSLGTLTNNNAVVAGTNSANGVRSMWDLGGGNLTVGYATNTSGILSYSNKLFVSSGAIVTNAGHITVGSGIKSSQNSMTVSNASVWAAGLTIKATNSLVLWPGGKIFAGAATNSGLMNVYIDRYSSPGCGVLDVTGNLNISGSTLNIYGTGPGTFVIARYGSRSGDFQFTNGVPEGGRLDYSSNQIAIIVPSKGTVLRLK